VVNTFRQKLIHVLLSNAPVDAAIMQHRASCVFRLSDRGFIDETGIPNELELELVLGVITSYEKEIVAAQSLEQIELEVTVTSRPAFGARQPWEEEDLNV
jgi:hypothetical protein